jgi:hypothetical protein
MQHLPAAAQGSTANQLSLNICIGVVIADSDAGSLRLPQLAKLPV